MKNILIGTSQLDQAYLGTDSVDQIYFERTLIWEKKKRDFLTFTAEEAGSTIELEKKNSTAELKYSTDLDTWTEFEEDDIITLANVGDKVYFRGYSVSTSIATFEYEGDYTHFNIGGKVVASGSIMSILCDNPDSKILPHDYCCYHLFNHCDGLTSAPELPATVLTRGCYYSMFYGCSNLTIPPELPATSLTKQCYQGMFEFCDTLMIAPELPATSLAEQCYQSMFVSCNALIVAPELPATSLADMCYHEMFSGCSNLEAAPELPAVVLAYDCYDCMFSECTSLTTAPELPATVLADSCYYFMFWRCTNLTMAPDLPVEDLYSCEAYYCYSGMFFECESLVVPPELPATALIEGCYAYMFENCTSLAYLPELPAEELADYCYNEMFMGCTNIKLSETQTGFYQVPYRIPSIGEGIEAEDSLLDMFEETEGTFVGTPEINTTYYLFDSSAVIPVAKPANTSVTATYSGSTFTNGYTTPTGVTMSGNNSGINAGTYTATYTLQDGYIWNDNTSDPITVTLTINNATMIVNAQSYNVTCTYSSNTWQQMTASTIAANVDGAQILFGSTAGVYDRTLAASTVANQNYALTGSVPGDQYFYYQVSKPNYDTVTGSVKFKISKRSVSIPSLTNGSKTYNGSAQSPTISRDTTYTTQSGTTSSTNAGSWTVTWALIDTNRCQWTDSTTANKTASWKISAKAVSTWSLTSSAAPFNGNSVTITFKCDSGVPWKCTSSNTNICTVSPATGTGTGANQTITITGKSVNSATVTVTTNSSNYASKSASCSVTVKTTALTCYVGRFYWTEDGEEQYIAPYTTFNFNTGTATTYSGIANKTSTNYVTYYSPLYLKISSSGTYMVFIWYYSSGGGKPDGLIALNSKLAYTGAITTRSFSVN